jgi:anti-sigma B factor antagonist
VTTTPTTPGGVGNFNVETMMVDREAVLRLSGGLDMHSAEAFGEAARLVHVQAIPNLILDLSALDFIDSSGLHQFVISLKRQREIGGDVVLRAPSGHVRRVLDIVGLSEIFTVTSAAEVVDTLDGSQGLIAEDELAPETGVNRRLADGGTDAAGHNNLS